MKSQSLLKYIQEVIDDEYAMSVLYYCTKKSLLEHNFTLEDYSVVIDGRYLGESIKVTNIRVKTEMRAVALLLSIRALMLNKNSLKLCEDDSLVFPPRSRENFEWVGFMSLIMDNWNDKEINLLYSLLENFYFEEDYSEEVDKLKESFAAPEYKNIDKYYSNIANSTVGVANGVIGKNSFVDADIESYVVDEDIMFVGNTAFAFCQNLTTLEFKDKVSFGVFPIVECPCLDEIIVPAEYVDYYKEELSYYADIICAKENKEDLSDKHHDEDVKKEPIDSKKLYAVFDKKATSYKYFWMMSILTLSKERDTTLLTFKDIVIRMAAMAWPLVFDDEIDLGERDMIHKYLGEVIQKTSLIKTATSNVVERYLQQHYESQGAKRVLSPLLKNVPYRFLSPWIKYESDEDVIDKSKSDSYNGIYVLHADHIEILDEWKDYIDEHYYEISDFAMNSFTKYVKQFNSDIKLLKLMTQGWSFVS